MKSFSCFSAHAHPESGYTVSYETPEGTIRLCRFPLVEDAREALDKMVVCCERLTKERERYIHEYSQKIYRDYKRPKSQRGK